MEKRPEEPQKGVEEVETSARLDLQQWQEVDVENVPQELQKRAQSLLIWTLARRNLMEVPTRVTKRSKCHDL